jgi:hypothetical protein
MDRYISHGMTPPAPGQEKEEPDLWYEDDIPAEQTDEGQWDQGWPPGSD